MTLAVALQIVGAALFAVVLALGFGVVAALAFVACLLFVAGLDRERSGRVR